MAAAAIVHGQESLIMSSSPTTARRGNADDRPSIKTTQGQIPACLVNASVTYCGNDQIYTFGGFDHETDEVYNHVLKLDLNTLQWELVDNYGDIPGVRMGHTANLWQQNKLVVFGGENEHREFLSDVIVFDIPTATWSQPEIRGPVPRGRARHAAVIHEDNLFVIGGMTADGQVILDNLAYLDLKTWTWSRTWSFTPRFDHTAWVWGGRLWVFGGLGPNMERTTDIWWLDLKSCSPSLGIASSQGTVDSSRMFNSRITYGPGPSPLNSPSHQLPGRSGSYAPNSGSVQVRSATRRRPTAPGATFCLRFQSGPHVPVLFSGTHFQVYTSGVLLDLITPSQTVQAFECNLSSLDLDTLRWQRLADGQEIFRPGYRWHYCTVNQSGTKAMLLGCGTGTAADGGDVNHMSEVLCIDLERYGLLGNETSAMALGHRKMQAFDQPAPSLSGLGTDLSAAFDQPPESGSGADFIITANRDDEEDLYNMTASAPSSSSQSPSGFLEPNADTSQPIHVHQIILQLRWPHFKRLYSSQMAEYHMKRMHIPEPYSVVRTFLYYLYTDSIAGHPADNVDMVDVAGMLVMANLYDMPRLRLLCVNRLSRELDVENAAIIWERAGRTNEEWLMRRAAQFCLANWGRIVRTDGFKSLSRQSLMELCEVADTEGRVVTGAELELVSTWGPDALYSMNNDPKRSQLALGNGTVDNVDDYDDDVIEVEGMELT